MRDNVTFIVPPQTAGLPVGNFAGYMDHADVAYFDRQLAFPHIRVEVKLVRCILRIERDDHAEMFAPNDPSNIKDIDVTPLVTGKRITFDQYLTPDSLARKSPARTAPPFCEGRQAAVWQP
jgi:hypothetical protein